MGEDWVLNHVGLVTTNRNATLAHFHALGVGVSVGPQPLLPHEDGEGSLMYYRTLTGDPVTHTYATGGVHNFTDGESQIGDCQLECYPMRAGKGMFISEYLAEKGPGINHICFNAPGVEEDTRILLGKGCDLVFNAMVNGKTVENYLDTRTHGDLMISLRPPASDWERAWKANNEAHPLVQDWRFIGVGIGVGSVETAAEYYRSIGFEAAQESVEDAQLGTRSCGVQVGPLAFELCEVTSADSVYADSLNLRGDGVNDLAFEVDDLEAATVRLQQRGASMLRRSADGRSAYFDTRAEGNIMVKLMSSAG